MCSVLFALLGTDLADVSAKLQQLQQYPLARFRAPRGDSTGRLAYVRTVETEAHATAQLLDRIFGQTRIRAGSAALCAGETALDALHERIADVTTGAGVSPHQFLNIHG
jgi:hypothetical protein